MRVGGAILNEIVKKTKIAEDVFDFWVHSPSVSKEAGPGQFVVIRLHEKGERIPLTVADTRPEKGLFRMVVKVVGKTTHELSLKKKGTPFSMWWDLSGTRVRSKTTGTSCSWVEEWE